MKSIFILYLFLLSSNIFAIDSQENYFQKGSIIEAKAIAGSEISNDEREYSVLFSLESIDQNRNCRFLVYFEYISSLHIVNGSFDKITCENKEYKHSGYIVDKDMKKGIHASNLIKYKNFLGNAESFSITSGDVFKFKIIN